MPLFEERALSTDNHIEVKWFSPDDYKSLSEQHGIVLSIGRHARLNGFISSNEPSTLHTGLLWVKRSMRGNGIGERLSRRLVVEAKEREVETVESIIASQYSLDIAARLFEPENLKFYHQKPDGPIELYPEKYLELPIELEQVRESLVRSERSEPFKGVLKNFVRINGFRVTTNISGIDIEGQNWQSDVQ